MQLTDAERAEFAALIKDSFDPELWLEEDLPALRAARRQYEEEQQQAEQQAAMADDEDDDPGEDFDDEFRR